MSNNNKQFFWEVKQFFNKKPILEQKTQKKDVLKTIKEVVSSNMNSKSVNLNDVRQNIANSSQNIKNTANYLLHNYQSTNAKETPNRIGNAPNKVNNLFNLYEMMGPNAPSSTAPVGRPRTTTDTVDSSSSSMAQVNPPSASVSGYPARTQRSVLPGTNAQTVTQNEINQQAKELKQALGDSTDVTPTASAPAANTATNSTTNTATPAANSQQESQEDKLQRQKDDLLASFDSDTSQYNGRIRNPLNASKNEILYGHSVRAYRNE